MSVRLKIYRGYANEQEIVLFGHVFRENRPDKIHLEGNRWRHAYAILRMFTVDILPNLPVTLHFNEIEVTTRTLKDGYFRFTIPYGKPMDSGWHSFAISAKINGEEVTEKGEFVKPYPGGYGLISDIDDTFLVSHSDSFFKKIFVLLTRNINKRTIFDGVTRHYRLLSGAGRKKGNTTNAFFYVSSSEWNLYPFIERFANLHGLPKAVLKLKDIKTGLGDFLFTGGGSHDHKFYKIKHLLEFYPELKFVLMGDDSQKDPFIYERIVKIFPTSVKAIYIRKTGNKQKANVEDILTNISTMDVKTCYFSDSTEAIDHSLHIGLISRTDLSEN
ncbi:MAG: App1 family protein [Pricia sp.]